MYTSLAERYCDYIDYDTRVKYICFVFISRYTHTHSAHKHEHYNTYDINRLA